MFKKTLHKLNSERITEITLFLILLACYTYFFPRWADPNQNSRLNMVIAVVEDGTFQIDKYVENTVDYAKVGDHYYSDKAPGVALLGIPLYSGLKFFLDMPVMDTLMEKLSNNSAFQSTLRQGGSGILKHKVRFAIAQVFLTIMLSAIPTALLAVLMYRLLGEFDKNVWHRLAVVIGYGLLTPAFAYAGAFYGHQFSTFLLFAAFYLIFMHAVTTKTLLTVGLLLGYSVVTEYPSVLMIIVIYFYTLYKLYHTDDWKRIGWVTLTGGIVAIFWMGYNTTIFGSPLELGYSHSELWQDQHHTGFMSLTLPSLEAMWGITFGMFRGLFFLSPLLLLSIPGFWLWWRSGKYRAEWILSMACTLIIFLFNSSSSMWWGGFAIGPRYLLPMLPFMSLSIIFVFKLWEHKPVGNYLRFLPGLTLFLYAWSFVVTWGLTLAEQSFPSDTIRNPFVEYAIPNWQIGNIARNAGTILGFKGMLSLIPLFIIVMIIVGGWWLLTQRHETSSP